jgi:tetratricopeptide (TPR) repeat protein
MFALALAFALQTPQRDTLFARAESLLNAGNLPAARRAAERLDHAHPDDPRVLTLLGRIWLAWPVFGRWQAESLFTRAGALDPRHPEPFYYLGLVGIALRGDDGEWVSRRGLTRVLALEPLYRDAWPLWATLYRGPEERHEAVAALARHAGQQAPDLWRSELLIELDEHTAAESLLTQLAARTPDDPAPLALLAQARYETGRDTAAAPVYEAALERAGADTGSVLWRQVRSAASPGEREAYGRAAPASRSAFFRVFWAHRRPDLRATLNGRIGEHFRRLREARRTYALQHPNSRYFHSTGGRSAPRFGVGVPACLLQAIGSGSRVALPPTAAVTAADPEETINLEDGLDDRGRIFVRYGPPDERLACEVANETWRYHLPEGVLQVTFARRTGSDSSGDAMVTPVVRGEGEAARWLLATDRPSGPEELRLAHWSAAFRGANRWQTELLVIPDSATTLAALTDPQGRDVARDSGIGAPLRLAAAPGRYLFALDAARGDSIGRYRGAVTLAPFTGESLAVSSLLATGRAAPPERWAMAAAAPAELHFPADRPLRVYAEIYGLAVAGGLSHYDVEYAVDRVGAAAPPLRGAPPRTSFRFRRERPAQSVTVESLVVDPGRLPRGRYRLRLVVTDALSGSRRESSPLEFDLR